MENDPKSCFHIGTNECGLVCGIIGAVIALALILFGFWNTVLIAALFAVGYFIGACDHKDALIKTLINKLFPPKGE